MSPAMPGDVYRAAVALGVLDARATVTARCGAREPTSSKRRPMRSQRPASGRISSQVDGSVLASLAKARVPNTERRVRRRPR